MIGAQAVIYKPPGNIPSLFNLDDYSEGAIVATSCSAQPGGKCLECVYGEQTEAGTFMQFSYSFAKTAIAALVPNSNFDMIYAAHNINTFMQHAIRKSATQRVNVVAPTATPTLPPAAPPSSPSEPIASPTTVPTKSPSEPQVPPTSLPTTSPVLVPPSKGTFDTGSGYRLTWERNEDKSAISFRGSIEGERWAALGFSKEFEMIGSQAVIVRFDTEGAERLGLYALEGKQLANVKLNSAGSSCLAFAEHTQVGGVTTFEFTYFANATDIPALNAVLGENGSVDTVRILWVSTQHPFVFWLNFTLS